MASPKLEPVVLSDEERQVLEGWARRRKTAQALALRSRIVLACAGWDTHWSTRSMARSAGMSQSASDLFQFADNCRWVLGAGTPDVTLRVRAGADFLGYPAVTTEGNPICALASS
jgi:hypothetical protein